MKILLRSALAIAICFFALPAGAAATVRVMILDGESGGTYHNWRATTQALEKELDEVGMFHVEVVTAPPADGDFRRFRPDWEKYDVIVFNYDAPDERWPAELCDCKCTRYRLQPTGILAGKHVG